ncbi:MAG: transporter, putative metabolite:H+ symporter [Moorella sp. (in: firmicutes)]|nr:MFS transporter [Moorella thermoacetica]MDN5325436.1 transporter, putative metabolite:H+ symporter [Moorella sp. (in: firmicutes)]OIQ10076.1 putative niacin/nicotinamide transporter NaiP [Moorella thermoacetica]OIQ12186.1 putative niacin/nicotinamide transporter NaiP [Moorella thermoacetica]
MSIAERLERLPLSAFHYKMLFICGIGWLFDAMDVGLVSFVLPAVGKEWHLTATQMGALGSIGLLGMGLGAVFGGSLSDLWGRKRVFNYTLIFYGLATFLAGLSTNYAMLMVLRFLVGLGLGAEVPVAFTLASEFSPVQYRGRMAVLLESFWAFGWIAAALIGYLAVPHWGWRLAFFIGALPALYAAVLRRALPESPRYLEKIGKESEARAIVESIERSCGVDPGKVATSPAAATAETSVKATFADLWSSRYARRTLCLWILWFGINFSYYGIVTWLPSLMVGKGFAIIKSFEYVLIMTLGQVPGYFSAAYLVEKIGRKATLVSYLILSGVAAYMFSLSTTTSQIIWWGLAVYFFNLGAWGVLYAYTPEMYPTAIRATGSGWASFCGRIGAILAPVIVGQMIVVMGQAKAYPLIFVLFTAVFVITALGMLALGIETKGKTLEELVGIR